MPAGEELTSFIKQVATVVTMSKFHCCIPGCNADKRYDRENKLSFHRFPPHSKKELRDGWVNNIRRDTGEYFEVSQCYFKLARSSVGIL